MHTHNKNQIFNIAIINVHAPTEDSEEIETEEFYSLLERTYDSTPSNYIKIMIGDLNAKRGREEIFRDIIAKESLHLTSNNNDLRAIDVAMSRNMIISSTHFPHKNIHKGTWRSPDGKTYDQKDYVLIDQEECY